MSLSVRFAARAVGGISAVAVTVVGFGSFGARPELISAPAVDPIPEALGFVAPEEPEQPPGEGTPELLGLSVARAAAAESTVTGFAPERLGPTATYSAVAAELREEAMAATDELAPTEVAASDLASEAAAGAPDALAEPEPTSNAASEPVEYVGTLSSASQEPDSSANVAGSVGAPESDSDTPPAGADDDAIGVAPTEARGWSLPPPRAAAATSPRYADPSPDIVAASGRPFGMVAAGSPANIRGVSDDEIRVSGLVSRTLAGFPFRPDVCRGALARFHQANTHGELTRQINFADCYDDEGRVELSADLATTLAFDDVFAVVPLASSAFFAGDTLAAAQLLHVGGSDLPAFCGRETPLGFGLRGAVNCPVLEARGYATLAEPVLSALASTWDDSRAAKVVYLVEAGPRGEAVRASRSFEADLLGWPAVDFFFSLPTPAEGPVTRWGSRVDEVLADDPDVVIIDGRSVEGLPTALRAAGFGGELVLVGQVDPLDIADPDVRLRLAPMTVVSHGLDIASRTSEGWTSIVGAAIATGVDPRLIGLDFLEGYVAADFFVRAVADTPEPLTAVRVANTVNSGWWYSGVEGVACGSWWPAGHLVAAPCLSIARVELFSSELVPVLGLVETDPRLRFGLR